MTLRTSLSDVVLLLKGRYEADVAKSSGAPFSGSRSCTYDAAHRELSGLTVKDWDDDVKAYVVDQRVRKAIDSEVARICAGG